MALQSFSETLPQGHLVAVQTGSQRENVLSSGQNRAVSGAQALAKLVAGSSRRDSLLLRINVLDGFAHAAAQLWATIE